MRSDFLNAVSPLSVLREAAHSADHTAADSSVKYKTAFPSTLLNVWNYEYEHSLSVNIMHFLVFLVCYFVCMRQKVICQNHHIAALKCRCMLILTDDVAIINDSDSWLTHLVNSWLINGSCLVTINVDFSTIFTHDSKIGYFKVSE